MLPALYMYRLLGYMRLAWPFHVPLHNCTGIYTVLCSSNEHALDAYLYRFIRVYDNLTAIALKVAVMYLL